MILEEIEYTKGSVMVDEHINRSMFGESLTEILLDRLLPKAQQRFNINKRGELNKSGLYIVSFLADGKPKRNYKLGRAKNIGKRLASYKTYHPEEDCIQLCACICIPFGVKWKMDSMNTAMLVNLFEAIVKQNLINTGAKQIRNTEWFGKGSNLETMIHNMSLFRQVHNYLANGLPVTPVTLHLYSFRLWTKSSLTEPALDITQAYKDPAKSPLDVAMYKTGYRRDGNDDIPPSVRKKTFGDFIKLSKKNKELYESLNFSYVDIEAF